MRGTVLRETESGFTRALLDLLRLHGWRVSHQRPAMTSKGWRTAISGDAGFPDIVAVRGSRLLVIELKSAKGKLGPGQSKWLEAFRAVPGAEVYTWRPKDWDTLCEVLK